MIKHALFLLGIALMSANAAEDPTPEQLLAIAEKAVKLPERGAWRITFSRDGASADSPAPANLAASLEATRVGRIQRDVITWPDGKTSEAWWLGKAWLADDPKADGLLFNVIRWPGRINLAGWIDRDSLKGIGSLNGKKVIVFESEAPLILFWPGYAIPDPDRAAKLKAQAFIALEEPRLLRVKLGDIVADFAWKTPPVGDLAVPPRFVKRYAAIEKALGPELKGARN